MYVHNETNAGYVDAARSLAIQIIKERGEVSSDDIRKAMPVPEKLNPSILGLVFRDGRFVSIGLKKRRLNKGGGGFIHRWRLHD